MVGFDGVVESCGKQNVELGDLTGGRGECVSPGVCPVAKKEALGGCLFHIEVSALSIVDDVLDEGTKWRRELIGHRL